MGLVSTLAGTVGSIGSSNGLGTYAGFYYPIGISSPDSNGNIYVADTENHLIRKINRYEYYAIFSLFVTFFLFHNSYIHERCRI